MIDDHRSGKVVIELVGRINKCGVISPRFDLQIGQIEQWTSNLLPSRQFGYIVMTTSLGIMDHEEVRLPSMCVVCCPPYQYLVRGPFWASGLCFYMAHGAPGMPVGCREFSWSIEASRCALDSRYR